MTEDSESDSNWDSCPSPTPSKRMESKRRGIAALLDQCQGLSLSGALI